MGRFQVRPRARSCVGGHAADLILHSTMADAHNDQQPQLPETGVLLGGQEQAPVDEVCREASDEVVSRAFRWSLVALAALGLTCVFGWLLFAPIRVGDLPADLPLG